VNLVGQNRELDPNVCATRLPLIGQLVAKTLRHMMLERGAHSNWAKNACGLANGGKSRYD
jgi:hypothetical protein